MGTDLPTIGLILQPINNSHIDYKTLQITTLIQIILNIRQNACKKKNFDIENNTW